MLIPKIVSAIAEFATKDTARFQVNSVLLERKGENESRAVATDGRILAIVDWKDEDHEEYPCSPVASKREGFSAIVPLPAWKSAMKAVPKAHDRPILSHLAVDEAGMNGTLTIASTDLAGVSSAAIQPVDGRYPPYERAIPTSEVQFTVNVNARLLAKALEAIADMTPDSNGFNSVTLEFRDAKTAIVLRRGDHRVTVTGVVMPVSSD